MNRLAVVIISCLLLSGPGSLLAEEFNLALWQRQEAARRKAAPPTRLSVNDANIHTLSMPGTKYHFTQLFVDPPIDWNSSSGISFTPQSDRAILKNRERELEEKIAEAQANLERYERQTRTVEIDVAPYRIWDKPGYIREKEAELQRRIEGERMYIYYTKKRLADLR